MAESTDESVRTTFRQAFEDAGRQVARGEDPTGDEGDEGDGEGEESEGGDGEEQEGTIGDQPNEEPERSVDDEFLSEQEVTDLTAKHKNDPKAVYKAMQSAFTKKTQALAARRRETETAAERAEAYRDFLDAYEDNPEAAIREAARQLNIQMVDPHGNDRPTATAQQRMDSALTKFKEQLGPELEYMGEPLAKAVSALADELVAIRLGEHVGPLQARTERLDQQYAQSMSDEVMKTWGSAHPGWEKHEDAMFQLGQKLSPVGMTEIEYLDLLYNQVTTPTRIKESVAREVSQQVKKISTARSGAPTSGTPSSEVREGRRGAVTFRQAWKDAKAGIRYADDDD